MEIICIGSVLWDIIGRSASHMSVGTDVPGRITRLPGGVALNIAMALAGFGAKPVLLTAVGQDDAGRELLRQCSAMGMVTDHVYVSEDLPTDQYMAIEGGNGLIAAIADAHSLEAAGAKILTPLSGALQGWTGPVAVDGNLTTDLLREIAKGLLLAEADLRVAPASPGKADRLTPFLTQPRATIYVNLEEAGLLLHRRYTVAVDAAQALRDRGVGRAVVTDGARAAAVASADGVLSDQPPETLVTRVTGAGDTFMAAHIFAEVQGHSAQDALDFALETAATYVSGETPF